MSVLNKLINPVESNGYVLNPAAVLIPRYIIIEADGSSTDTEYATRLNALTELAQDREWAKKLQEEYEAITENQSEEDFEEWAIENVERISGARINQVMKSRK